MTQTVSNPTAVSRLDQDGTAESVGKHTVTVSSRSLRRGEPAAIPVGLSAPQTPWRPEEPDVLGTEIERRCAILVRLVGGLVVEESPERGPTEVRVEPGEQQRRMPNDVDRPARHWNRSGRDGDHSKESTELKYRLIDPRLGQGAFVDEPTSH